MYCDYSHPDQIKAVVKAVEAEDIENLRFYLADGADPDMRDEHGLGLLHIAAKDGKAKAAEVLLEGGADPDLLVGITQHTPLFYAARTQCGPLIQLLARHHAEINAVDGFGLTPLHMAAHHGESGAVKELIAAGANVLATEHEGRTPRDLAQRQFDALRQASHGLCCRHLREAEMKLDAEGEEHRKAERDIAALKRHNPKQFRLKS